MEEILNKILTEMQELKANQVKMEQNQAQMEQKIDSLGDRMDAHKRETGTNSSN